ncbi:MAG: NAD-dependent protein deacylase, partial [Clostridiales bacterium]|nr:NAD-dependent protein deacylase [Clostridiales bacterium]
SLYSLEYILDPKNCIDKEGNQRSIPYCSKCNGVVKPDVVLYEEMLDTVIMEKAAKIISESDTLIVAGTSLVVYPAAGLINYFRGDNLVLINRDRTPFDQKASLVYHDSIGKVMA